MLVFTEEWLTKLINHYETLKKHEWRPAYCVAMKDRFRPMRESIEVWVADQPEDSQAKLIKKLQSLKDKNSFLHTYHELVVGSLLKGSGLQTEYEKNVNGKTPDWYVAIKDPPHHFIVDVFTKNISDSKVRWDAWRTDLDERLRLIPLHVCIELSSTQRTEPPAFDRNEEIASRIKVWLEQKRPDIGDRLQLEDFIFEVSECDSPFRGVWLEGNDFFCVSPVPIKLKILEKIECYENLIASNSIPLVVAVVAGPGTLYETEELKTAIHGRDKKDGLFACSPLLSGVIWASRKNMAEWEMRSCLNPLAQNRLPANVFGNNSLEC
jgi:hypothetical protein